MLTTSQREAWTSWLVNERHISLDVARDAGLLMSGTRLTIPVRTQDGVTVFNKYRRAPWITEGSKYNYDRGAEAMLFGLDALRNARNVVLTEGELDALALRTLGYTALSTTGGAQSFRPEWIEKYLKGKSVTILYDADKAGIEGAVRVARMIPTACIALIPVQFGKDATEVIHNGGTKELQVAIDFSSHYDFPPLDAPPQERLSTFKKLAEELREVRRAIMADAKSTPLFVDGFLSIIESEVKKGNTEISRQNRVKKDFGKDTVERARSYPIGKLIKINTRGFAQCVYHNEDTPSMKCYADNHCYSYCCGKRSSAIDIYMATHSCDFKTALNALSHD